MPIATPTSAGRPPSPLWWAVFSVTAGWSLVMSLRCQVHGDAIDMMVRGWRLVFDGVWLPFGLKTSAGGFSPGGLTALVAGLPLAVWPDYRSVAVLIALVHAAAFLWLAMALRPALGDTGSWLLLLVLWVDPWRMAFSTHPWNSSLMLPLGMIHLATALTMSRGRVAWATFVHALTVGLGLQLHTSFAVLAILSVLLWLTGMVRVHWGGLAAAVVVGVAALAPWVAAVVADPELLPAGKGFPMRGLILVYPTLRGLMYWLKMGGLSLPSWLTRFDFTPDCGATADAVLTPLATGVVVLGHLTTLVVLWATWRLVRRALRQRIWRGPAPGTRRAWLERYVGLAATAALASFAVSPTTVMFWQLFVVQHAIALTVVLAVGAFLRRGGAGWFRRAAAAWVAVSVALILAITFGAPMYRQGGRQPEGMDLRYDHPMFHRLGMVDHGSVTVNRGSEEGWWPAALEPADP
ncbi:MAG: hypothetical protein MUC56_09845 [Thermoanaerobaculales bacterium]|jgi:hypothetical protein|nr:hypothetical protein [Thermoanaerobaculales bacterium]